MEAWVWIKGEDIIKDILQLKGKNIIIKHNEEFRSWHIYVLEVLKVRKISEHGYYDVFSTEDFWARIRPCDEVMVLK